MNLLEAFNIFPYELVAFPAAVIAATSASTAENASPALPIAKSFPALGITPNALLNAVMPPIHVIPDNIVPTENPKFFTIPSQMKLALNNFLGEYHSASLSA